VSVVGWLPAREPARVDVPGVELPSPIEPLRGTGPVEVLGPPLVVVPFVGRRDPPSSARRSIGAPAFDEDLDAAVVGAPFGRRVAGDGPVGIAADGLDRH